MAKKSLVEVGSTTPSNLKFGLVVAIVLVWADFLHTGLSELFSIINIPDIVGSFIIAVAFSIIAYFIISNYRHIRARLRKIKV